MSAESAIRPWILSEINYAYVKENPYQVATVDECESLDSGADDYGSR